MKWGWVALELKYRLVIYSWHFTLSNTPPAASMEARAWMLICSEVLTCGINNCPNIKTQNITQKTRHDYLQEKCWIQQGGKIWKCKPGAKDAAVAGAAVRLRSTAQPSCEFSGNGRPTGGTESRRCEPRSWPTANHSHCQKGGRLGSEDQVPAAAKGKTIKDSLTVGKWVIVHVGLR